LTVRALAWAMGLGTAIVLLALAAFLFSPQSHIRVPALATLVTVIAVQLAFMGGIQSGCALAQERIGRTAAWALLLGWLPALGGFAVLWLPVTKQQLAAALALFVVAFAIDAWLVRRALLPRWFLGARLAFTVLACAAAALALWLA
jgi:hypothetical protein